MRTERFGEGWLLVPDALPDGAIARARVLVGLQRLARARHPDRDVVLGGSSILVLGEGGPPQLVESDAAPAFEPSVKHTIEVVYDGEDLPALAAGLGVDEDAVARLHYERRYVALLTGFMPGFAYLGEVDPRLARPRLAQPRRRVPAGAVGIAGSLTGIYPFASPGGWNLVGDAVAPHLFDPAADPPVRIAPLDEVELVRAERVPPRAPPAKTSRDLLDERPPLLVEATSAIATVQDRGRFGLRGHGLPWSGPLDRETHDAANLAVGNGADAATIEVISGAITLAGRHRDLWISIDGQRAVRLERGQTVTAAPRDALVSYVAVRGGVDVPRVLGSRATLLVASLGGYEGRPLRRGDALPIGADPGSAMPASTWVPRGANQDVTLRGTPSIDARLAPDAFDILCASVCTVSPVLDRVGLRLEGVRIPRASDDRGLPDPALPGAIQVTTDGTPIVLGPDAAVTGGYPVVGHLDARSRAAISRLRPGAVVRFDKS